MRIFLLVLLIFTGIHSHAQNFGRYMVELEEFKYEGRTHYLLTIDSRDPNAIIMPFPGPDFEGWVEKILDRTWVWILDELVKQERITKDGQIYKALSTKETMVDGRSKIQILFDGPNLTNIAAVMRSARRGTNRDKFVSIEQRRDRPLADILGTENYVEWKNFIKRTDVSSDLTSVLLDQAVEKGFFDYTRLGQPVDVVVGETYSRKVFYFMDKYGFHIVDYEEADISEAGYKERLMGQARSGTLDIAFVRSLRGIFTIAVPQKTFIEKIKAEVSYRTSMHKFWGITLAKKSFSPQNNILRSCRGPLRGNAISPNVPLFIPH